MAAIGPRQPRPSSRSYGSVVISTAATGVSDDINISGLTISSIEMSTAWTSADIAFEAVIAPSTAWKRVFKDSGTQLALVVRADTVVAINPDYFHGLEKVRLVSVTTGSTAIVAQAAARTITFGLSEITKRS